MMMHEAAVFAYLSPAALFRIRLLNEKGKEDSEFVCSTPAFKTNSPEHLLHSHEQRALKTLV